MSLTEMVEADIRKLPEDVRESAVAGLALAMAERIDNGRGSASECGKVLMDALEKLRALAPPKKERTRLDGIRDGRRLRVVGGSAGED